MTERLRGTSLVAAPLIAIGVLAWGIAVSLALWGLWEGHELTATFWAVLGAAAVTGITAFGAARGCFVEIDEHEVRDVIGWITVQRIDRRRIVAVRLAPGAWRRFMVDRDDGTVRPLVGASPRQFLARLAHDADERDTLDVDRILGDSHGEPDETGPR